MERHFSVRLSARVDSYVAAIKAAEASTTGFARSTERNMTRVGKKLQGVGRKMTRQVSLPLAALGVGAAVAAVQWESAFTGVIKTVSGTTAEMAALEVQLRDMAKSLPQTHAEIAGVAEAAGQLGIKAEDIAEFTRVMLGLGVATNVASNDAAIALARVATIMQTSSDGYERMGSVIVELGNNAATSEAEIIELGTRIASAGKIAGLSEADIFAFGAATTEVGVKAEAGGTALSKVFLELRDATINGGKDLENIALVAGMTAAEFKRAFEGDASGAIATWIAGVGKMEAAGQSTTAVFEDLGLADQRLMRAIRGLAGAGDLLTDRLGMANKEWGVNNALSEEAQRRYDTLASKFGILRNNAVDLGITLGDMLYPAIEALMKVAGGMIEALAAAPPAVQALVMSIGGIAAAAGPAIFILGSLIRNFKEIRATLAVMKFATLGPAAIGAVAGLALLGGAWYAMGEDSRRAANKAEAAAQKIADQKQKINELADAIAAAGDPMTVYKSKLMEMAMSSESMVAVMGKLGVTIDDIAEGNYAGADHFKQVAMSMGYTGQEANLLKSALLRLDGEMMDAINIWGVLTGETEDLTLALDENGVAYDADAEAAAAAAAETEAFEERQRDVRDAIQDQIDALDAQVEAYRSAIDAYSDAASGIYDLHDAEDAFTQSVKDYHEVVANGDSDLREHLQALDDIAESAQAVADSHLSLAEEEAALNGTVLTATETIDIQNDSLLAQAATLDGPARQAVLDHVARLNGLPPLAQTLVEVLIAEGKLTEAEAVVEEFSKPRSLALKVDIDDAKAMGRRNQLEQPLYTTLYVNPVVTGGTTGGLTKFRDDGGFGHAGDVVAERRPEFVGGGLVTGPRLLTTSQSVTSGTSTERLLRSFLATAQNRPAAAQQEMSKPAAAPIVDVAVTLDGRELRHEMVAVIREDETMKAGAL